MRLAPASIQVADTAHKPRLDSRTRRIITRLRELAAARLGRPRRDIDPRMPRLRQRVQRLRAVCRRWVLRSRLGQWMYVIHRVRAEYRRFTGRPPALLRPRRYTEKMQWRKLFDLDPLFAMLSDKLAARDFVTARIGPGRQAELLWVGSDPDAIPFDRLVPPYVLKSSHASGHSLIVQDSAALDVDAARATARAWLAHCHGTLTNEPAYIHLRRRLVVERLLSRPDGRPPLEHRVHVFDGKAIFIRTTTLDAARQPRFGDFYTPDWAPAPIAWNRPSHRVQPARPACLTEIITLAERLGAGLTHCRIDFYDRGDTPVVGEMTLYTRSGMIDFADPAQDFIMGASWIIKWPMLRALWAIAVRRWEIRPPRC